MAKQPKRAFHSPVFHIEYEDNFLLVVNKQAGFLTVPVEAKRNRSSRGKASSRPGRPRGELTLIDEVRRYLSIKSGRSEGATPVHRLDRDTSGLLVIAKSQKIAVRIKEQFKQRKPEREYYAIVAGKLAKLKGTFQSYLETDEDLNQVSSDDSRRGKLAITHYEVVEEYQDSTKIRATLETGRRNQIRVHFADIGHPILGDVRYKPEKAKHPRWPYPRLALHAAALGFVHPMLKKSLKFTTELPVEFSKFAR